MSNIWYSCLYKLEPLACRSGKVPDYAICFPKNIDLFIKQTAVRKAGSSNSVSKKCTH